MSFGDMDEASRQAAGRFKALGDFKAKGTSSRKGYG